MTSDQEPRYRLVDSDGNIVGSLYGKADGSVAIQETDSGSDREVTLAPDGTFSAPSVETPSLSTEKASIEQNACRLQNEPGTENRFDIPDGTATTVEFVSSAFADAEIFDIDTDNNEIDVLETGRYVIAWDWRVRADLSGSFNSWSVLINSSEEFEFSGTRSADNRDSWAGMAIVELAENDTLSFEVLQNTGTTVESDDRSDRCQISVWRVG